MMATGERLRANSWGRYYVTDDCNACGICAGIAPANFARSWDGTYFALLHQPEGAAEQAAVREAMEACPLGCIGDDGDTW